MLHKEGGVLSSRCGMGSSKALCNARLLGDMMPQRRGGAGGRRHVTVECDVTRLKSSVVLQLTNGGKDLMAGSIFNWWSPRPRKLDGSAPAYS